MDWMLWVDIETTGLNPDTDKILQIAYVLTNFDLTVVHHFTEITLHCEQQFLEQMDDWCKSTHTNNGLLNLVTNSTLTITEAETEIIMNINSILGIRDKMFLSGNSVHFDKSFLKNHLPKLHDRLSHQIVDVSSLGLICKNIHPKIWSFKPQKLYCHTALSDINESISEYEFYLTCFLNKN